MQNTVALAALALTGLAGCGLVPTSGDAGVCSGPVTVQVTNSEVPVISWTPACRTDYVAVGYAGLNDVWWAYSLTRSRIGPSIKVGDAPPGTRAESMLPLVRGVQYSVSVGWRRADAVGQEVGSWGYTRFVR